MAWSYDAALGTDVDRVRFLVQDNNSAKQLFQDEEIDWVLSNEDNIYTAAATLCDQLVTRAGGVKSKKISEFTITYDLSVYRSLAMSLRARGAYNQVPYAGGISELDKTKLQDDPDAVQPKFSRRLHDNPEAPEPGITSDDPLRQI